MVQAALSTLQDTHIHTHGSLVFTFFPFFLRMAEDGALKHS